MTVTQIKFKSVISQCTQKSHSPKHCFGSAIIETDCTRTVCGQQWLESYFIELSQEELNYVKKSETQSQRPFRFGDGKVVYSTKRLKILAKIGETKCHIETYVIPLLLSKASMKRTGRVLDIENDRSVMFNKPVKPDFTSSGHYCVNIMNNKNKSIHYDEQLLAAAEDGTSNENKNEHDVMSRL